MDLGWTYSKAGKEFNRKEQSEPKFSREEK
jgi:hypothetical protein